MKTEYVLGFAYDPAENVLLIRKDHPDWQRGLWNGLGGRVRDGEDPVDAMRREFAEEARVFIAGPHWVHVATLSGDTYVMHVFTCHLSRDQAASAHSATSEPVQWHTTPLPLSTPTLPNTRWLVPLTQYGREIPYRIDEAPR